MFDSSMLPLRTDSNVFLHYKQQTTRIMAIGIKDIAAITSSSIQEMVIYPTTDEQEVMTTRMTGTEETKIVDQESAEGGKFHFVINEILMYITKKLNCSRS